MNALQSRRQFLKTGSTVAACAAVLVMFKTHRAFAQDATIPNDDATASEVTVNATTISFNHGHNFSVPLTTLLENGPTTYNIQGASGHPHTIDITEDILLALNEGTDVEITSTVDANHSHTVTLQVIPANSGSVI